MTTAQRQMITKIPSGISFFLALVGFFFIFRSMSVPGQYSLFDASAVQMTQVYSEAIMYALQGCGLILVAIFIHLVLNVIIPIPDKRLDAIKDNTAQTNTLLTSLGRALLRR